MDSQEIQALIDRDNLGRVAAARYEAESFLHLHGKDYFATPQNGKLITGYLEERGLDLTAENFETAFQKLKSSGKILPPREAVAMMNSEEFKEFIQQNGGDLPEAYSQPTSADYNRPKQGTTLAPVSDPYPQDAGKTFTARQLAGFSADRYRAYHERNGTWGK